MGDSEREWSSWRVAARDVMAASSVLRALPVPAVLGILRAVARRRLRRRRRWRRRPTRRRRSTPPVTGQTGDEVPASGPPLGFPVFATKNTTRVAGGDASPTPPASRWPRIPRGRPSRGPTAVILAEVRDWRTGLAASVLVGQADPRADAVRRRRHDPGRDQGRARRAAAHRLQGGGRRAGDPRGDEGAGRGLQDDRRQRRQPGRAGGRRRPPAGRGGRRSLGRGRRRQRWIAPSTRCPPPAGRPSPATRCCG